MALVKLQSLYFELRLGMNQAQKIVSDVVVKLSKTRCRWIKALKNIELVGADTGKLALTYLKHSFNPSFYQ